MQKGGGRLGPRCAWEMATARFRSSDDVPGNHPLGMATSLHEGEGADGVGCVEVGV